MQGQQRAAVSSEAVASGVTEGASEFYETFSLDVHSLGRPRHSCEDASCGRCGGPSTKRDPLEGNARAGDVTSDTGTVHPSSRTYHPLNEWNDPEVASGNVTQMLSGPRVRDAYLGASVTDLMRASVEPDRRGGGSNGRKRSDGCSPDFGAVERSIATERMRYA